MNRGVRNDTGTRVLLSSIAEITPALQGTSARTTGGESEILSVTPSAVGGDQRISYELLEVIRPQGEVDRYRIRTDDLVLVLRLPLKFALIDKLELQSLDRAVIASGTLAILRVDRDRAHPGYVAWCLLQPDIVRELARANSGTNVQFISMQSIRKLRIPLPPIGLQRSIAAVLEAQRRIETLQDAHRAATRTYINAVAHRATASALTSLPNRDQR